MTTKTPAKINRRPGKPKRQSTKGDGLIVFDSDVERYEKKKRDDDKIWKAKNIGE